MNFFTTVFCTDSSGVGIRIWSAETDSDPDQPKANNMIYPTRGLLLTFMAPNRVKEVGGPHPPPPPGSLALSPVASLYPPLPPPK